MKKLIATIFASIFLFSSHSLAIDLGATIGLSTTKHLGYAFQWFSMALAFLILIIIFFVRTKNE